MYESEREELVKNLESKGINDRRVLDAFYAVERHKFVPEAIIHNAYLDTALPIGFGQTISQPYTVAFMTQALELVNGERVLEIGTGSGYQAAILTEMGMKVYSIERNHELYTHAQVLFEKLNLRVALRCSDGTIGWSEFAPFDAIIVTAGSPSVPENLKKQLSLGGRIIIPVGDRISQVMKLLWKVEDDKFKIKEFPQFAFVPLIGKQGWKEKK